MSVEELKREVLRRRRALPRLLARRAALDKQIAELQDLLEALGDPKRLRRKLAKTRAEMTPEGARPGNLADQIAEVFQGRKSGSLAAELLLRDQNRFHTALGVFKREPAPKFSIEQRNDHAAINMDKDAPPLARADANPKACAALTAHRSRVSLRLADENGKECGGQAEDEDEPETRSTGEDIKVRLLHAVAYEDAFSPSVK